MTFGEIIGSVGTAGFALTALVQTVRAGRANARAKAAEVERDKQAVATTKANEQAEQIAAKHTAYYVDAERKLAAARKEIADARVKCIANATDDAVVDLLDRAWGVLEGSEADHSAGSGGDGAEGMHSVGATGKTTDASGPES